MCNLSTLTPTFKYDLSIHYNLQASELSAVQCPKPLLTTKSSSASVTTPYHRPNLANRRLRTSSRLGAAASGASAAVLVESDITESTSSTFDDEPKGLDE